MIPEAGSGGPSISVVIPLYNHARFIDLAIDSVFAQTSAADEIIILDDGSTDGGSDIAERMLTGRTYTRVVRQENRGAHATINRLVCLSRADYVAVLNSDDLFQPGKLARCRALLRQAPETALVCGAVRLIDQSGAALAEGPEVDWLQRAKHFRTSSDLPQLALLNENFVATTSNMVFARSLWRRIGGFQDLRFCHDLDFLMAAFAQGSVILDESHIHISYRVHPTNAIKQDPRWVQLEVAAVAAFALRKSGARLLDPGLTERAIRNYRDFARNKPYLALISLLQTVASGFNDRGAFYCFVNAPARRSRLIELMLEA
jgi:glycosyltransferase involved in cell wall biosynthesis